MTFSTAQLNIDMVKRRFSTQIQFTLSGKKTQNKKSPNKVTKQNRKKENNNPKGQNLIVQTFL